MKLLVLGTGPSWDTQKAAYQFDGIEATGLDIIPSFKPDVVRDILRGLPFDSNSFDEVRIEHVLEHISGAAPMYPTDNYDFVMSELHRVLVPGGKLRIEVPYWKDDHAVEAAGHVRFFNENSFVNYYVNEHAAAMGQVLFSKVESCTLEDTQRAYDKPARVVKIVLIK